MSDYNNLVRQDETFTRWIKGGIRKYIQRFDSEGDWEATTIIEDSKYSYHYIIEPYLLEEPDVYGFSIDVKDYGNGRTKIKLLVDGPFVDLNSSSCIFNIDTVSVSETYGNIQPLPSNWYRCSFFVTTTAYSPFNLMIMIVDDDGKDDYQGDGKSGITIRFPKANVTPLPPDDDIYVIHGIDDVITNTDDLTIFNA